MINEEIPFYLVPLGALYYILRNKLIPSEALNDFTESIGLSMNARDQAVNIIKEYEGLSSKNNKNSDTPFIVPTLVSDDTKVYAYYDSGGVPTIGWGTTHYPDGKAVSILDVRTKKQCEEYFQYEFQICFDSVQKNALVPLTKGQLAGLTSFSYNVGLPALFGSTLWRLLQAGNDKSVVAAQFDRWVYDNGKRVQGLVNRRKAERALFES